MTEDNVKETQECLSDNSKSAIGEPVQQQSVSKEDYMSPEEREADNRLMKVAQAVFLEMKMHDVRSMTEWDSLIWKLQGLLHNSPMQFK